MTKKEPNLCHYCGLEIRSLDRHAHNMSPDKDSEKNGYILISCILNRYYKVVAVEKEAE